MNNPLIFKNPEVIDPERWLDCKHRDAFEFIPFSAGGRNCIGKFWFCKRRLTYGNYGNHDYYDKLC